LPTIPFCAGVRRDDAELYRAARSRPAAVVL